MSDDFVSDSDLDDNYRTNIVAADVELSDASFIVQSNKASMIETQGTVTTPNVPDNIGLDQKLNLD